jgi:tetratricopeptide (TPR) repeat protein
LERQREQDHEQLPLVVRIADRADPELAAKLKQQGAGWPWRSAMDASRQLAGLLGTVEEAERILGPVGPKLAAASLHPWIWNAAVDLWDHGHLRQAVQTAAQALFDKHLPAKLGVPAARSARDLIVQAFSTDPPAAGSKRLRLPDYPESSPNWISQHDGARFFGMGCAQLIRNLVTHGAQPDEQTALEQLASLSLLARLIDRANDLLQTAQSYADLGDKDESRRFLDKASDLATTAHDPPPQVYWYTEPFFRLNIGLAQLAVGDYRNAQASLRNGLDELPKDQQSADWVSEYAQALECASS